MIEEYCPIFESIPNISFVESARPTPFASPRRLKRAVALPPIRCSPIAHTVACPLSRNDGPVHSGQEIAFQCEETRCPIAERVARAVLVSYLEGSCYVLRRDEYWALPPRLPEGLRSGQG
jgi:hypothetical protein